MGPRETDRKEEGRGARARASVKTHHSVNNAQSESDSKSGEIVRTPPQMRQERTEKSTRRAVVLQIFPRASFYTAREKRILNLGNFVQSKCVHQVRRVSCRVKRDY